MIELLKFKCLKIRDNGMLKMGFKQVIQPITENGSRFCYLVWLAIFLIFATDGFCSFPRLLITLGPKCDFTDQDLQKKIRANVICGKKQEIKKKIKQLDRCFLNHMAILKKETPDRSSISSFARIIGYATLHLNTTFKEALKMTKETLAKLPCTDKDLPRLHPLEVGLFYDLTMKVMRILKNHQISYWATCGTLLGVVRHQGMVPWDDDIDIAIFENDISRLLELEEMLLKEGLLLTYHPKFKFYKICFKDGQPILKKDGSAYPWTYPFIDLFPISKLEDRYAYSLERWREEYPQDYFLHEELAFPLPELPFGPMTIPVPHNSIQYVSRMYGKEWNEVAYIGFYHRYEQFRNKIKVDLVDRSAPAYILP
jgi:hypothetical protein